MSLERMRISNARNAEHLWHEDLKQNNPANLAKEYRKVQTELLELEEEFNKSVEGTLRAPAPALVDPEQALQASRKMHRRIEELRAEKERLEYAIKKSGGTLGDHTVS